MASVSTAMSPRLACRILTGFFLTGAVLLCASSLAGQTSTETAPEGTGAVAHLEPWEAVVVERLRSAEEQMGEAGYARYDVPRFELLGRDSVDTGLAHLPPGDYRVVAVCDTDCSDVDLMVTDARGDLLALDVLPDHVPIVDFTSAGGRVGLAVRMVSCATDLCYYGLQVFRRN